jgi:hypothetical protein
VADTARKRPPNAGKGRPKGALNKTTKSAKEALALAFAGIGGVPKLIEWAKDNRDEFYKLWVRLVPTEVTGENGGAIPVTVAVRFEDIPTE